MPHHRWFRSSLAVFGLVALAASAGCAGTLPEVVYANQVEEYFPEPEEGAADAETAHALRLEAGHCAARLNRHRDTAELVTTIQGIISAIGGATGGVGGALAVVNLGQDVQTAMGVMGSIGAGITVVGNFILGLVANPLEEIRLRTLGAQSWDMAVELHYAGGDTTVIRESLMRCTRDEGIPRRVVGTGAAYSE